MTKFILGMAASAAMFQEFDVALVWSVAAAMWFAISPGRPKRM